MAVVLSSDESSYFSSAALRRSHSQPKFRTKSGGFHASASAPRLNDIYHRSFKSLDETTPSSSPPSPQALHVDSSEPSCASTPTSNFSLTSDCEEEDRLGPVTSDEHILSCQYEEPRYYHSIEELNPPPSPRNDDTSSTSSHDHDSSVDTSRPVSPTRLERAEDDIAIEAQPSRHVDYLSHNWREEDIWSSWKHIVSKRGEYSNSARLENASWRTWIKSKNKLRTVSPETLNWLKDCDVTWLYGPLQTGLKNLDPIHIDTNSTRISKTNSFFKKPILKKRSMSERMLQRSLSASSLIKQAAAAVQAQQKEGRGWVSRRPSLVRAATDYMSLRLYSDGVSHGTTSLLPSTGSSGVVSPSGEKKHIHFNEQVSQCIAVEIKGEDDDDDGADWERDAYDSDSDDGAIMMKRTAAKVRPRPIVRKPSYLNANCESKTIAMLPSTRLKYREDAPESQESAMKHSAVQCSPLVSPSSSHETLRPSKKSGKLSVTGEENEEEEAENEDERVSKGWRSPPKSGGNGPGVAGPVSSTSLSTEPVGMRRTESGMLMPYEEGEVERASEGLLSRIIDTVNTARDIAHVIWNVGWRK